MRDLSVIIPARCELFLRDTVGDILKNSEADTEVIVTLDGQWANPPIPQHERVNIIYVPVAVGQRAGQNLAARLAQGRYIMKVDAHCCFDKGFDRKMIEAFKRSGDNVTMVPVMRNFHVFDWKCYKCGWTEYQGARPKECPKCGKNGKVRMKMVWGPRSGTHSRSYCFDSTPKFNYFKDYESRPEYAKAKKENNLTESMSLQGSCFMATRENYWKLELCDEDMGNWGNQGIEVACKTWLSGGRVLVCHDTWYAHLFRTRSDFGFPWPVSGKDQHQVKENVKSLFWEHKWPKMIHPVSWLVEKFWPITTKEGLAWTDEDLKLLKENEAKL